MCSSLFHYDYDYYYCYYKICIAHKFKHARVGGAGVAGWGNDAIQVKYSVLN